METETNVNLPMSTRLLHGRALNVPRELCDELQIPWAPLPRSGGLTRDI